MRIDVGDEIFGDSDDASDECETRMTATDAKLLDGAWTVNSEEQLRSIVGVLADMTRDKKKPVLDQHTRRFIDASPYVCVATSDGKGGADVSPRGDDRGFVRVLDESTLVLPERPGNRLADTLTNLLRDPGIGLLFLVPGSPESLRANGKAHIQYGPPSLLESMGARGRVPSLGNYYCHRRGVHALRTGLYPKPDLGPRSSLYRPSSRPSHRGIPRHV